MLGDGGEVPTGSAPARSRLRWCGDQCRKVWSLVRGVAASAWNHRVHGLAAEVGFWALLSLAPLLLGILGLVGYLAPALGPNVVPAVEKQVLSAAGSFLTPETIDNLVEPLVRRTLSRGRAAVASVGFLVAFWTGSTALGAGLNAIAIAYGWQGARGVVRTRLIAFSVYTGGLVVGVVFLPLLVVGPRAIVDLLPAEAREAFQALVHVGYWPAVTAAALTLVLIFYHVGVPSAVRWRDHLPGAVLATVTWLLGSIALRAFLRSVFETLSTYGPLAAPIAALLFFYLSAFVVLVGAELNAQLISRRS